MTTQPPLHHEAFTGDPEHQEAPVHGRERPRDGSADTRLLEREHALDELRALVQRIGRPQFGLALIEGERGIGKTALVNTVCRMSAHAGSQVFRARGSEQEHDRPLGIVHQIVAQLHVASLLDDAFRQRIRRVRIDGLDEVERFELFQEVDEVLVDVAGAATLVLVIDDVHLADPSSLDWLHFMCRRIDSRPLVMILTSLPPQHVLTHQPLDSLLAESSPRRIELRPLSAAAVTQLVHDRFGAAAVQAGLDVACHEATRGNPALLFTLFDDLARSDGAPDPNRLTAHVHTASPHRLVRSIVHRTSVSGPESLAVAQSIALLDGVAELGDIAEVAQLELDAVTTSVEHLTAAGILEAAEPLRFVHPLVRSTLVGAIPPADARRLHHRCARVLQRRGEPDPIVAAHFVETDPGARHDVAAILLAGCRQALVEGDSQRAARMLARAEAEVPDFRAHLRLLLDVAESHARLGDASALPLLRDAEEATSDPEHLLPIVFAMAEAPGNPQLPEALRMLRSIRRRGAAGDGTSARIDVALCLLNEPTTFGAHPPLRPVEADDPPIVRALRAILRVADPQGATAVGLAEVLDQTLEPDDLVSDDPVRSQVAQRAIVALTRIGRTDIALRLVDDAQRRGASGPGDTAPVDGLLPLQAMLAMHHGQLDVAKNLFDLSLNRPARSSWSFGALHTGWTATLAALRGDLDEARARLEAYTPSMLDIDPQIVPETLGWLHLLAGRLDDAITCFSAAARTSEACGITNPACTTWRSGLARSLALAGDVRTARSIAAEAVELARAFGAPGPLAVALGALAATQPRDRIGMLESAVQAADRSPDVFLTVTTRLELGRALHKEGHDDQAIEVLRVAGDGAHNLDAPLLAEETVAQLRACGSRPVRLAQRGIESLTPAQLRTVRLAASGSTNTEIARTLFISVKTVESHLARGYRKLGVRSRRELADVLDD